MLTHLAFGIGLMVVQAIIIHRFKIDWQTSLIDAAVSSTVLNLSILTSILVYRNYQPGSTNRMYRFVFAIAISYVCCLTLQWILSSIYCNNINYINFLTLSMPVRFIFSLLIIAFITIIYWLMNILTEQKENEKRKSDSEQLLKEAELTKLRQQLQPHFLFNSLNSISALTVSKPVEARKMIQQLSDFLRGTLKRDDQLVKLSEELEYLKLYLDIEKVRFGNRLNVEFIISEESQNRKLPALLLQPIVENAIKFGLYDTIEDVTISIHVFFEKSFLVIQVKNPYDNTTNKIKQGVGFGLSSIQRRLYLIYMRQDLLQTSKTEQNFITTLKIPSA